jgi:hypothetical protein
MQKRAEQIIQQLAEQMFCDAYVEFHRFGFLMMMELQQRADQKKMIKKKRADHMLMITQWHMDQTMKVMQQQRADQMSDMQQRTDHIMMIMHQRADQYSIAQTTTMMQ